MRIRVLAILLAVGPASGCGGGTHYGLSVDPAVVTSLTPTLSWRKFPDPEIPEIRDVTYELRVIRERDGEGVVRRDGLNALRYTLEDPLEPATAYRWSVRPWFTFDGERRVGPWAQKLPVGVRPGQTVVPVPPEHFERFETPAR